MIPGASSEDLPGNEKASGEGGHLAGTTVVNERLTTPADSVKREVRKPLSGGFVKLVRGRDAEDLFRDPLAYTLLSLIAYRARRSEGLGVHGLEPGEALIGDHESVGMTRKQYRVRLNRLVCGRFVAIRRASRGTIAKVLDTRIFDINAEEGGQPNGQQRAITGPQTRRERKIRKREAALSLEDAIEKYTLLYPEKDVRGSLSRMSEEGRLLLPPFIEEWLDRENRAKPTQAKRKKKSSKIYTEADFEEWKATLHAPPNCTLSTADKQTEGHFRQYMLMNKKP